MKIDNQIRPHAGSHRDIQCMGQFDNQDADWHIFSTSGAAALDSSFRPSAPKVLGPIAVIRCMEHDMKDNFGTEHYLYLEAEAMALSIATIRKAMGKANPSDFPTGSPRWGLEMEEFAQDVQRALDGALGQSAFGA